MGSTAQSGACSYANNSLRLLTEAARVGLRRLARSSAGSLYGRCRWSGRAGALCNRSRPFLRPGFEHHVEGPLRGASNMAEAAALLQHLGQLRLSRLGAETLADLLRE